MKEAREVIRMWNEQGAVPELNEAMDALAIAIDCDPENAVIVRWKGLETFYMIDEETLRPSAFESEIPLHVRQHGILRALRAILNVPEGEDILSIALFRMREIRMLQAERESLINGGKNRGE